MLKFDFSFLPRSFGKTACTKSNALIKAINIIHNIKMLGKNCLRLTKDKNDKSVLEISFVFIVWNNLTLNSFFFPNFILYPSLRCLEPYVILALHRYPLYSLPLFPNHFNVLSSIQSPSCSYLLLVRSKQFLILVLLVLPLITEPQT